MINCVVQESSHKNDPRINFARIIASNARALAEPPSSQRRFQFDYSAAPLHFAIQQKYHQAFLSANSNIAQSVRCNARARWFQTKALPGRRSAPIKRAKPGRQLNKTQPDREEAAPGGRRSHFTLIKKPSIIEINLAGSGADAGPPGHRRDTGQ